jgi:hypothetical protein
MKISILVLLSTLIYSTATSQVDSLLPDTLKAYRPATSQVDSLLPDTLKAYRPALNTFASRPARPASTAFASATPDASRPTPVFYQTQNNMPAMQVAAFDLHKKLTMEPEKQMRPPALQAYQSASTPREFRIASPSRSYQPASDLKASRYASEPHEYETAYNLQADRYASEGMGADIKYEAYSFLEHAAAPHEYL